jgi:ribosomal protein L24
MRGPEGVADHTAKVIGIDTDTGRILVEGLTIPKADGKLKPRAVHASNCIITKVDTTDKLRVEKLSGGAEPKEERAGRKTGMQDPRVKKAIGSNSSQSESAKSKEPAKKTIEEKNKNDAPKKDKESTEESA